MKDEFKRSFVRGAAFAAGAAAFLALGVIIAQSINTFTAGELVSASKINENFQMAAPEGAIMAFYLSACPSGWIAADGTNSTPDLRGQFIRGLNSFGSAAGTRADGNEDLNGGARTLGDYQADAFQGHRHAAPSGGTFNINLGQTDVAIGTPGSYRNTTTGTYTTDPVEGGSGFGASRTATETRPRNVALIYCMRKDS